MNLSIVTHGVNRARVLLIYVTQAKHLTRALVEEVFLHWKVYSR